MEKDVDSDMTAVVLGAFGPPGVVGECLRAANARRLLVTASKTAWSITLVVCTMRRVELLMENGCATKAFAHKGRTELEVSGQRVTQNPVRVSKWNLPAKHHAAAGKARREEVRMEGWLMGRSISM